MESIFSKTLNPPSSISPKSHPLKPSFPKTLTLIRASHPKTLTLKSLPSLFKPAILSLTAAAAVFLSRHSLLSLAAVLRPPPAAQSETLDVDSLRSLVELKVKLHKLPEAMDAVDQLILLDPLDPDLHLLKANLHTYNGDTEKAREGFERILSANPFAVEAYHGLVMAATRSRDVEELDVIVERVEGVVGGCEKEKERWDLKLLMAQVWIIQEKYEAALGMYEEMVRAEPGDFRPYLCMGIVYTLMRRMEEADKNFKLYRELVPEDHPYAQLFENSLSGINAKVGSLPR